MSTTTRAGWRRHHSRNARVTVLNHGAAAANQGGEVDAPGVGGASSVKPCSFLNSASIDARDACKRCSALSLFIGLACPCPQQTQIGLELLGHGNTAAGRSGPPRQPGAAQRERQRRERHRPQEPRRRRCGHGAVQHQRHATECDAQRQPDGQQHPTDEAQLPIGRDLADVVQRQLSVGAGVVGQQVGSGLELLALAARPATDGLADRKSAGRPPAPPAARSTAAAAPF